jgi:hypothetical protein
MADITIIVIESGGEARKRLKKSMPPQVRAALDQVGRDVDMESGEELRDGLAAGFPRKFVVPEEVLVFPPEEEEPETTKLRRRRMKDLNNRLRRKRLPGNTEGGGGGMC